MKNPVQLSKYVEWIKAQRPTEKRQWDLFLTLIGCQSTFFLVLLVLGNVASAFILCGGLIFGIATVLTRSARLTLLNSLIQLIVFVVLCVGLPNNFNSTAALPRSRSMMALGILQLLAQAVWFVTSTAISITKLIEIKGIGDRDVELALSDNATQEMQRWRSVNFENDNYRNSPAVHLPAIPASWELRAASEEGLEAFKSMANEEGSGPQLSGLSSMARSEIAVDPSPMSLPGEPEGDVAADREGDVEPHTVAPVVRRQVWSPMHSKDPQDFRGKRRLSPLQRYRIRTNYYANTRERNLTEAEPDWKRRPNYYTRHTKSCDAGNTTSEPEDVNPFLFSPFQSPHIAPRLSGATPPKSAGGRSQKGPVADGVVSTSPKVVSTSPALSPAPEWAAKSDHELGTAVRSSSTSSGKAPWQRVRSLGEVEVEVQEIPPVEQGNRSDEPDVGRMIPVWLKNNALVARVPMSQRETAYSSTASIDTRRRSVSNDRYIYDKKREFYGGARQTAVSHDSLLRLADELEEGNGGPFECTKGGTPPQGFRLAEWFSPNSNLLKDENMDFLKDTTTTTTVKDVEKTQSNIFRV